jgi:GntR family transcriptional regulator
MARDRRPLAIRVAEETRHLIAVRSLAPGDQLPSEAELSATFDVARTTVREALKLLEQDGLIRVRHGVGRFVAPRTMQRPITRLESVTAMMEALGYQVTNRVVEVGEAAADAIEAEALKLRPGDPVVRLERLRLQGEDPLIYSLDVLPRRILPDALDSIDWSGSLGEVLQARGHPMSYATAQIRASRLPRGVGTRLGIESRGPWLLLIQTNFTDEDVPIIHSHDYHRSDRFTFHVLRRAEPARVSATLNEERTR